MTIFITQGNFTRDAMAGMVARPEDRQAVLAKLAKAAGGKLLSYYFTFGEYDFLTIYEAPDPQAMASMLLVGGASGSVTNLKTTVAMTSADMKQCFTTAGGLAKSFRPAGT
jgi:uncharacterized protein with GYD domain